VGTGVLGALSVASFNQQKALEATYGVALTDVQKKAKQASTFALVSDIFLGVTILSAGVSTFFTVRYFGAKPKTDPQLSVGLGNASLSGTF
jgi:hypothetical protein